MLVVFRKDRILFGGDHEDERKVVEKKEFEPAVRGCLGKLKDYQKRCGLSNVVAGCIGEC